MSERTIDVKERRSEPTRATRERESSSSVRSSPIGTVHRQVGNQAVQENYIPTGLRDRVGLGGSRDNDDRESDGQGASGGDGKSDDREQSEDGGKKHGPQRTGKFIVEFDDDKVPGWKPVTIPSVSIEQGSYREGTEAPHQKKADSQPIADEAGTKRVEVGLWGWLQGLLYGTSDIAVTDISVTVEDEESDSDNGTDE